MRRARRRSGAAAGMVPLLAVILLSGCGGGASPSPTAVPTLPVTPSSSPSPSDATSPASASPASSAETTRAGVGVADLAGTWTGEMTYADESGDPAKASRWTTRIAMDECVTKATCGTFSQKTADYRGKPATCEGTLTYRGFYKDRAAFEFEERITSSGGATRCGPNVMVLTPLASGATLGVEERHLSFTSYGVLVKSATP